MEMSSGQKDILVLLNYNGEWKNDGGVIWRYEASKTKYVKVPLDSTYSSLLQLIYVATGINSVDTYLDLAGWNCYPDKQIMPPYDIVNDDDVSTFIECYRRRDKPIPLCISTRKKNLLGHENRKKNNAPLFVDVCKEAERISKAPVRHDCRSPVQLKSQSVNQDSNVPVEDKLKHVEVMGLDDFEADMNKFENYTPQGREDLGDSSNDAFGFDSSNEIDDSANDEFDYDEVFAYRQDFVNHHYDEDDVFGDTARKNNPVPPYNSVYSGFESSSTGNDDPNTVRDPKAGASCVNTVVSTNVHQYTDFRVGEICPDKESIIIRLRVLNMKANREFRISHSDKSRVRAVCTQKECSFKLNSIKTAALGEWVIRKYVKEHTCSLDNRMKQYRGSASSKAIAYMVNDEGLPPMKIKEMLRKNYGINVSYWKAWKAKEIGMEFVRGGAAESYAKLPGYLWLLEKWNPGTYTSYETTEDNCFKFCFLALGSCVAGFKSSIRPVIAVDASHLKGRYRGKLFIATTMDGNGQIFPVAFGVAATESDETWSWFFKELRKVIGYTEDLVFISDRHRSIEKCCLEVFPHAVYGICMFHLGMNIAARFKVKPDQFLYSSAKAYTEQEFEDSMHKLRNLKRNIYDYLMDADPKKWARCFFPSRRYSIMTTNIAESMNAVLKDAREYPIIGMFETIRMLLQKWFYNRYKAALEWQNPMCPKVEEELTERDDASRVFKVISIDEFRFNMIDGRRDAVVDINRRTCTCNVFQVSQLPCEHAVRACRERNISIYTMCSRYYNIDSLRDAYKIPIMPVPHPTEWSRLVPAEVSSVVMKPPLVANKLGRPKNKRMLSQGEVEGITKRLRCGRCKQFGHNRQTCTGFEYVPPPNNE